MAVGEDILQAEPRELEALLPEICDGDVLLCSASDPFSRMIAWSTKSPWTHVGFAWRWPAGGSRVLALECVQKMGVHAVSMERFISQTSDGTHPYPGNIVLARHAKLPDAADMAAMIRCGIDHMGDRFSPAEIMKIGLRIIAGRSNRKTPRPLRADNEMICSEYVDKCFKAAGVHIPWDGLGFIAPADVAADPDLNPVARIRTR
jgi:hypothetical protein